MIGYYIGHPIGSGILQAFNAAAAYLNNGVLGRMKKNVAGQKVGAQVVDLDGAAFASTVSVYVTGDAGAQGAGGGGAVVSEGNGYFTYSPTQAETNYDLIAFTFTGTNAVPTTVQVYTSFPQTGDSFGLIGATGSGLTSLATQASVNTIDDFLDTEIAAIKAKTDNLPSDPADASDIAASFAALNDVTAAEVADAVWDELLSGHGTVGSAGRTMLIAGTVIDETTVTGTPTTTTINLVAGSAVDDYYNDLEIVPVSGALLGQARVITDYTGATKLVTVDEPWTSALAVSDAVIIRATHKHSIDQISASVWAKGIETGYTAEELLRVMSSVLAGKVSGAGTGTETFRDVNDTKDRVISVNDVDGNRTSVTLDGS